MENIVIAFIVKRKKELVEVNTYKWVLETKVGQDVGSQKPSRVYESFFFFATEKGLYGNKK